MTLDELLEKHPAPWEFKAMKENDWNWWYDANGHSIRPSATSLQATADAVNRIHSLQAENASIRDELQRQMELAANNQKKYEVQCAGVKGLMETANNNRQWCAELREQNAELNEAVSRWQADYSQMSLESAMKGKEISNLRAEIDTLKASHIDYIRRRDDAELKYAADDDKERARLKARNEHLKDDVERWRRKCDDATRTRDTLAQENSNLLDGASKVGAENAALKARVAELEHEKERIQINSESAFEAHCVAENERVRTQRRYDVFCALVASGEHCIDAADKCSIYLDAFDTQEARRIQDEPPPEPPAAEVWRIDDGRTIENECWYEINKGERSANIEGLERREVERIVAALNKEQSC